MDLVLEFHWLGEQEASNGVPITEMPEFNTGHSDPIRQHPTLGLHNLANDHIRP